MQGVEASFAERRLRELIAEQEKQQAGIERVRQQCESYASQIQEAGQGLAELLQRQKVLANEIEIFKQDVEAKDAATQVSTEQKMRTQIFTKNVALRD